MWLLPFILLDHVFFVGGIWLGFFLTLVSLLLLIVMFGLQTAFVRYLNFFLDF